MKQRSTINILHGSTQLHYMVELLDAGITDITHGVYSYRYTKESIQFIRNKQVLTNDNTINIHNVIRDLNTWTVVDEAGSNLYIPTNTKQRRLSVYIPRYSMESFYDTEFGGESELTLSGLKYIISAYTFVAGVKVVLGSYIFDLESAVASPTKTHFKADDYQMKIDFEIVDPVELTYHDDWIPFRHDVCEEPLQINNSGSVIGIDLEPVILSEDGTYYMRSSEFLGGIISIPFQKKTTDFLHTNLEFDGDARITINFNEVYGDDLELYLAETYGMWQVDEEGNYIIDEDTGEYIPKDMCVVYELVIRDKENIFDYHNMITGPINTHTFLKPDIQKDWDWYKPGLIMQASIDIYDITEVSEDDLNLDYLRSHILPFLSDVSNEIPLNINQFRYLVPLNDEFGDQRQINLGIVNMIEYNVDVVNKINKQIVNIKRPEDYKSNIIKPVFIRTNPVENITIFPTVTSNISINLGRYKSSVKLFYIRVEGVDFIEIDRMNDNVIFQIDGNLLPNETPEGTIYILNEKFELVTTGHYKYEQ